MIDDPDARREVAKWAHMWLATAELQANRVLVDGVDSPEQNLDMNQFVWALHNAAMGARRVLGGGSNAAQQYDNAKTEVKAMRDILSHYDEYLEGRGQLQWPEGTPPRLRMPQPFPFGIVSQGDGDEHFAILLTKRREPDGSADTLSVIVEVKTALLACALLVEAALDAAGITGVSATIERVKNQ